MAGTMTFNVEEFFRAVFPQAKRVAVEGGAVTLEVDGTIEPYVWVEAVFGRPAVIELRERGPGLHLAPPGDSSDASRTQIN